jgi:hypothetical protein
MQELQAETKALNAPMTLIACKSCRKRAPYSVPQQSLNVGAHPFPGAGIGEEGEAKHHARASIIVKLHYLIPSSLI